MRPSVCFVDQRSDLRAGQPALAGDPGDLLARRTPG